jgi:hypothetical protein
MAGFVTVGVTAAGHSAVFHRADSVARAETPLRSMGQTVETEFRDGQQSAKAAVLQDAPKMVRGLIRHGMGGSIPKDEQDSFVLLYQDEDVWNKLADFSHPNNAYLLLVDAADNIRWRTHGEVADQQALDTLRDEISKIPISNP